MFLLLAMGSIPDVAPTIAMDSELFCTFCAAAGFGLATLLFLLLHHILKDRS